MSEAIVVLPANDPRRTELEAEGWAVIAYSWGAQLSAARVDRKRLAELAAGDGSGATVRPLGVRDVEAILELDAVTAHDYPGSTATRHEPLTRERATTSSVRCGFGAFDAHSELVAMTFVDIDTDPAGERAEVDFTVVDRSRRGQGLGSQVKAASVLELLGRGIQIIRTGGSAENRAILAANRALGFSVDEEWVTLTRPNV